MKKRFISSIILAIAAISFCLFAVACTDANADRSAVYGEYYAETENEETTLTLSESGFSFTEGEKTETGKFSYDGKKIVLSFEKGETEAVIKNNVLTFGLNGVNYSLYKKVEFTVSFVADGKTTAKKVVNGKKAVKIDDPKKEGYVFIGWYEDEKYTSVYDFDNIVTSDKVVYGRFVEVAEGTREFNVTFYDGDEVIGEKSTIGGKIYDYGKGKAEGKTFLGWWVSDYQSGDKLTYKYDGETLDSDTNFYAVYEKKGEIAVSVSENKITWTSAGVNKQYAVSVAKVDNDTGAADDDEKTVSVGGTSYNYDFKNAEAGDYKVSVKVDGKTYYAYYKNKALARVCGFEVTDTFVLRYEPVENAKKYYITVVCGNKAHRHDHIDNGVATNYNFSNCEMGDDGIGFTVEAEANGYASSVSDVFVVKRTLDKAENVAVKEKEGVVTWNAVENATNYTIETTSNGKTEKITVNNTEFSYKGYAAGELKIKIVAIARGYNASASTEVTFVKRNVSTPGNVKIGGNVLTFAAVKDATGYVVKIGDKEESIDGQSGATIIFLLSDEYFNDGEGTYSVTVKAKGKTTEEDSFYSDAITVVIGDDATTATVTYANGELTWTNIFNAESYVVKLNGRTVGTITDTSTKITFTQAGQNDIEVYYFKKDGTEKLLAKVKIDVYSITFDARGGDPVETVYKATGDEIKYPATELKGYSFAGWFNVPGGASEGKAYVDGIFEDKKNITLYASWTGKKYSIVLDYGEAGDSEKSEVVFGRTYSVAVEKTASDLTKNFLGWYSQPNAQGTRYTDERGNSLDIWNYDESDRVFYAAWVVAFTFNEIDNGKAYSVSKATTANAFAELTVPSTYNGKPVTTVEGSAFRGCLKLKTVNLPDTVKLVETGTAFLNCVALTNVNVYETNSKDKGGYSSVDGVLIYDNELNGVELKYFPQARSGEYVIPEVVETIPVAIFKSSKLTKVTVPASVTAINANAFYYSRNLKEVVFKEAKRSADAKPLTIAANAFGYCQSLKTISLPSRLVSFDSAIFDKSTSLSYVEINGKGGAYTSKDGVLCSGDGTQIVYCPIGRTGEYTVPSGVSSIGENAFNGCYKLTSVVIPGYVTEIGKGAFGDCASLTGIAFTGEKTDAALTIGEQAFYGCSYLTSVTLPANLALLGKNAFGNTKRLTEVIINCGNATFENAAFGTTDETPVYYVEKLDIGKDFGIIDITGAFGGTTLTSVSVDKENQNYTVVDNVIFDKAVTKIVYYPIAKTGDYVIPATVTEIGANVFANKKITKITIGNNIEKIGDFAFLDCSLLTEVIFEDGEKSLVVGDRAFQGTAITAVSLPTRTNGLGEGAFENCVELVEVSIPAGIRELKANTFDGCLKLTTVTLNEGLTSIGDGAFANCVALETITVPSSVTSFGKNKDGAMSVFTSSKALKNVVVASDNAKYASLDGVIYEKDASGELVTVLYCPIANTVGNGTFTVPSSVTLIATGAFEGNAGIEILEFEGAPATFAFGSKVFNGCTALREVTLPSGLKEIGESLFENCSSVESIFVPKTVTLIGSNAFRMCVKLSSVTFEDGGEEELVIADGMQGPGTPPVIYGAFVGCTALTTIALPERTTKIGAFAFAISDYSGPGAKAKTGLKSIVIPASVTTIGNYAFYATGAKAGDFKSITFAENSKLETIGNNAFANVANFGFGGTSFDLPDSVKTIGGQAFNACSKLAEFNIGKNSQLETIGSGAFMGCASLIDFEVPSSVKTIGASAFQNAKALASVTFEENSVLDSIGESAFASTALTSFTLPTTENDITLGANLFKGCTELTTVNVSKSVTTIGDAFDGCASITNIVVDAENKNAKVENSVLLSKDAKYFYYILSIPSDGTLVVPDGIENIDSYALYGKTELKKVVLPTSLRSIGKFAFATCTNLETVEFADKCELETIGVNAFDGCSALTSLALPSKLTTIDNYAFKGCAKLASVVMEDSVTSLGNYLFQNCTSLKTFEFPIDVTAIPKYFFSGCSALTSVSYRGDVTAIGTYCFEKCTSLTSMVIPETVTSLGSASVSNGYANGTGGVFSKCTKLESVTLPKDITVIAAETFMGCSSLKTLEIPDSVIAIGISAFNGCSKINNLVIPEGVKLGNGTSPTSNNSVFKDCKALSEITFEGTLNYVGKDCFSGCASLATIMLKGVTGLGNSAFASSGLRYIELPDSLKTITAKAFKDCKSLEEVVIPASVTKLEAGAFDGCTSLSTIAVDERNTVYKSTLDGKVFSIFDELVYCPISTAGKVVMGEGETLYAYAFSGCKEITEVVLADGTTEIPDYAFQNCVKLAKITIPETVTRIGKYAFSGCSLLTALELPVALETIDNNAFEKCAAMTEIVVPDTVKTIGGSAFANCTKLKKAIIGKGVSTVGTSLFSGCAALTDVTLPSTLTALSNGMFSSCTALESITLPKDLVSIGFKAFEKCTSLTSIVIPDGVKAITTYVFDGCTNLASVTLGKGCESLSTSAFRKCVSLKAITLPAGLTTVAATTFTGCTITVTVPYANADELPEGLAVLKTAKGVTVAYTAKE